MKNLILVAMFGKYKAFFENNNKIEEYKENESTRNYATVYFNGPRGIILNPDEIPYSNCNRTLDDISYSFGMPTIPMLDLGVTLANRLGKQIGGVYFISETTNSGSYDAFIRDMFKKYTKRDIYKGQVGYAEIVHSIGMLYSVKTHEGIQIISPNRVYATTVDVKRHSINPNASFGITLDKNKYNIDLFADFEKRFSSYLNLFDNEKNLTILRGMYLAGFYGYIYENKKDDIVNIYQDRRVILPFAEIKKFMDEVHIPAYKKILDLDSIVYTLDIPLFNDLFKEYKLDKKFVFSQDDFMLYAKMLIDFNNDITVKAYRLKSKDFICFFDSNSYGRKSKEFWNKQIAFVEKAFKKNRK